MKRKHLQWLKIIAMTVFFCATMNIVPGPEMNRLSGWDGVIGIPSASATHHLGILGRTAPELQLQTWIDGNGEEIQPIRLGDYRGNVVYLYFFQDW